ncbi:MAG: polyisoprenoid-binding protein [Desulfuromonas sp.]|nr:MAG: polyisoprenoid-binding protein [Desulfuromonas sp.]
MLKQIILAVTGLVFSASLAAASSYTIDPVHSQVHFTIPHLMVFKVRGDFSDFTGSVEFDAKNGKLTKTEATIQIASLDTREPKRDEHLKSPDFFAANQHPTMTFTSTKVEGNGSDMTVTGDLTIRGVTREVTLKGGYQGSNTDPWGNERIGFAAETTINRHDYGLNWNKALETGGVVVGEEVVIGLEIQAIKNK